MITLSKSGSQSASQLFNSTVASPAALNRLASSPFNDFQSLQIKQHSRLEHSTRAKRNLTFRGTNPIVTGVSGNGSSSTFNLEQMHSDGTWNFFRNGSFQFTPNGLGVFDRADLFPVKGKYQGRNTLKFSGSRTSRDLTSRNSVTITGRISLRTGVANVSQRTVLIMSANINNTPFNQTIDRTVQFNLQMVRTR